MTQQFTKIIEAYTGLHVREQDVSFLWQKIRTRMQALRLTSPEQYYQLLVHSLEVEKTGLIQPQHEWQQLIQLLATGESYFYRDQGQFRLLQQHILPDLIRERSHHAAATRTKPSLRLWSAGCSTGEEAYSLAILVHQLIPDLANWDLLIMGTDLNADAIARARKGIYSAWSFRTLDEEIKTNYFRAHRDGWKLNEQICQMVTFASGNLVNDPFPSPQTNLNQIDLIICRNVFIYFTPEIIAAVLVKLSRTLRAGGYLMTGHAELHNQKLDQLQPKIFPESFVYQRLASLPESNSTPFVSHSKALVTLSSKSQPTNLGVAPPKPVQAIAPLATPHQQQLQQQQKETLSEQDALSEAERCFCSGDYAKTIQIAKQALAQADRSFALPHLIAQAYASLGEMEQATSYCETAIAINSFNTAPYYLLAHLAREQKHPDQAKNLLKRIIYLDPTAITAYLELSSLYTEEGDAARAKKMQATALELMQRSASGLATAL